VVSEFFAASFMPHNPSSGRLEFDSRVNTIDHHPQTAMTALFDFEFIYMM